MPLLQHILRFLGLVPKVPQHTSVRARVLLGYTLSEEQRRERIATYKRLFAEDIPQALHRRR